MRIDSLKAGRGIAVLVVGMATLAILCLATIYIAAAQPILDDWCFAVKPGSPFERANALFQDWSGRWPTMFLLTLTVQDQALHTRDYMLLASGGLGVWFIAFLIIADRAIGERQWPVKLSAAAVMLATFWATAHGTGETFYWIASYINYGLAFLFGAACISAATRESTPRSIAIACICGFISSMFSELAGIVLFIALAALILDQFLSRQVRASSVLILGAVALGTALVIFSPGNAARQSIQLDMSFPKIVWTVLRPYESPLAVIADPRILALVAAVLVLPNPKRAVPARWWLVPLTAIAASFVAVLAFAVATGTAPTYRVLSFLQAVVLGTFFFTAWRLRGLWSSASVPVHLIFAALLVTAPAVGAGLHDLPLALGEWRQAHQNRWAYLHSMRGRDVELPDHARYLSFYPERDISLDSSNGINRCMATYFGLRSIRSVGPDGRRWRTAY